jgi:hypothetical protein
MTDRRDYNRSFTIENVDYPVAQANAGDVLEITIASDATVKFSYTVKTGNPADEPWKSYSAFWGKATAAYDPKYGIILGSSVDGQGNERSFSIALGRYSGVFRIHVYVSQRAVNPPQPDDGSWTGTGN